jgi:hypothetical protein
MVMEEPETQLPVKICHPAMSSSALLPVSIGVKCRTDEFPVTLFEEVPAQQFVCVFGDNRGGAVIQFCEGLGARRHVDTGPDVGLHLGIPVCLLRTRTDAANLTRLDPDTKGKLGAANVLGPAIVIVALILQAQVENQCREKPMAHV